MQTTTTDTTYNGWTNYETWIVNLWIEQDEGTYNHFCDTASELAGEDTARRDMADTLREWVEEMQPELDGMFHDLLTAAIEAVNWGEIADHWIEAVTN